LRRRMESISCAISGGRSSEIAHLLEAAIGESIHPIERAIPVLPTSTTTSPSIQSQIKKARRLGHPTQRILKGAAPGDGTFQSSWASVKRVKTSTYEYTTNNSYYVKRLLGCRAASGSLTKCERQYSRVPLESIAGVGSNPSSEQPEPLGRSALARFPRVRIQCRSTHRRSTMLQP
jgi:hypothetical protein